MLIPILPQMKQELNISQFQVSLIITLFSFSAAVIIPFSGFLSDRYGRKKVIIPSLILFALGGLIAGGAGWLLTEATAYWTIIAGRALQGIGAAGTAPIAMALVGDIFKGASQSKALGLIEATNGLGKVASPILGTIIALIFTWYAPFFVFAILCILAAVGLFFMVKEPPLKEEAPKLGKYIKSIKEVFKKDGRWLIATFFVGTIGLFVLFGVLFYLSDILETQYKTDGLKKGYILAIPLLAMATTSYTTGRLIGKNFPLMKKLIVIGLVMMAGGLIPLMFLEGLVLMIILLALNGVGTGLALPCINSFITGSVSKAQRGMITSLYSSVRFGGVAFGPPIFGWLMTMDNSILFGTNVALIILAIVWTMWAIQVKNKNNQGGNKKGNEEDEEYTFGWKRVALSKS